MNIMQKALARKIVFLLIYLLDISKTIQLFNLEKNFVLIKKLTFEKNILTLYDTCSGQYI